MTEKADDCDLGHLLRGWPFSLPVAGVVSRGAAELLPWR